MGKFIDTSGNSTLALGICARCARKMPLGELRPDPNSPGLLVCAEDRDQFDPWRLPPPTIENIGVPNARPDEPIVATGDIEIDSRGGISASPYPTNLDVYPSST